VTPTLQGSNDNTQLIEEKSYLFWPSGWQ